RKSDRRVCVGPRKRRPASGALLVAARSIRRPTVEGEADQPDDRDHRQDEHDEDLALAKAARRADGSHRSPPAHWILALLAVENEIGPKAVRRGRIGSNEVWTETFTQSPGWQVPVTVDPSRSRPAY